MEGENFVFVLEWFVEILKFYTLDLINEDFDLLGIVSVKYFIVDFDVELGVRNFL